MASPILGSRRPDYDVRLMNKDEHEHKNYHAGAAWINQDGTISIKLAPYIMIHANDKSCVMTLKPRKKEEAPEESY